MLAEAPKEKVRGDYDRRWMSDDYFDFIVWYTAGDTIQGFQLCYGKPHWERALMWLSGRGFTHMAIDSGEDKAEWNRTPILVPDGSFPEAEVMREFNRRAANLPRTLRDLVAAKVTEFVAKRKH